LVVSRSKSVARFTGCKLRQLEHRGGIEFVTEASQVEERIATFRPDILFVESCFYYCATANVLAKIVRKFKTIPICVYAVEDCPPRAAARFIYWGVESYINFRDEPEEYLQGIDRILNGIPYVPAYVAEIASHYDETPTISLELTERELQIVRLITAGQSQEEVGRALNLKAKTVENHKTIIYGKCNVRNAVELLRFVIQEGVLTMEDLCL
jgi:two-component system invasion response regulator UvrY